MTAVEQLTRKCNVCKRTLPWTPEHFDYKHGRREYGLKVICRHCSCLHYNAEAVQRRKDRREQRVADESIRTTPNRLCRYLQPNMMDWCDWI